MKFTIQKNEILDVLLTVGGVVPSRSMVPMMSNVLLTAGERGLRILATDQNMTLEASIPASIQEDGEVAVPSKKLVELLKTFSPGEIEFETDGRRLIIKKSKGKFQIAAFDAADYPSQKLVGADPERYRIDKDVLAKLIDQTNYTVSKDTARLSMAGLYFKISEDVLTMVGTDGHRLAVSEHKTTTVNRPNEVLIPSATIRMIEKLFSTDDDSVEIEIGEGAFKLEIGDYILQSKLITERFPDYTQVIPKEHKKKYVVSKSQLERALSQVGVCANPLSNLVKFHIADDVLTISSRDYEIGTDATKTLSIDYDDEEMEIGFNGDNLLEIIKHLDSEYIEMRLNNPVQAAMVLPEKQVEGENCEVVIMPLRLTNDVA